jgi:co-chaperonin GroES (HSP10)
MIFEADNIPADKLPKPSGWRILVAPVKIKEKTDGGIVLVDESKKTAEYFRDIGRVLAMGTGCYEHPKFQGGVPIQDKTPEPWCKVGDVISYNSYTGKDIALNYDGVCKLKVINDDEVVAVITDLSLFDFL